MSPNKSIFGRKKNAENVTDYPLPPSCSVSNLTEFLADGNASFLRAARSGNLEKVIEFLKGTIDINTSNANGLNALHLAAKEGHVNVVTELIKRGANVNAATKKGNTALHIASLAGQEEVVKVLVQLGANVNVQSQNGFTPLYMAAQENHDAVVSFLLANGANQSLATEDGFTPLAVALQQGHDKVVAVLLENDTKGKVRLPALHIAAKKDDCKAATLLLQSDHNPDVTSKSGFTPLHIAAHYGNENIAKILLSKGADVNYAAKHQITPLHVASKWGKINMVTLLLEKGANIDASTRDGLTPLHCAARSGHDQVVDLLLEKGAPFLAKTKNGLAPLHMASQGDHVDSARILLYHKAPVDDVTVDYLTALHVAAHCGHVKVAKLLLDRKADPNARALNGFTPLHIACKKNRIKVVELLLKHGASIEATTESGLTPLHVASFMGCMNIVIYLIQNGSNPDVPTVRGETPLHLAARANQTDIIRILLRNGASVDARAREEQTPLHIAARLGNVDIVSLLLQHGAAVDAMTKDMYTPLHITAKEDQEEVAAALLDHGASLTATTKKGFTPLHLAAKYGNIKVARLLLQKGAPVDAQGKNGVTPLHVAAHYDHVNVALLLLDKGASPHAMAKNGYTPLHIAAKKNQMDIASTLLEYGANTNSESKAGFTPLHLSAQEGHADMSSLLIENKADVNHKANNGLTPLHLCAQDDRVNVAQVLVKNGAEVCPQTKAGYTPLHVASHFGQINMVRFLLQNNANVHTVTSHGYTPLHQAAQQGHTLVVNLLLENQASPNVTTVQGQTPLSIAQRLGYISVVETLKVVTETTVTTTTTTVTEEKYKVVAPETMQETFMTDSEDEGGEEAMLGDQSYRYLTADEMKSLGDDSLPIDVTKDEKQQDAVQAVKQFGAPMVEEDNISPQHGTPVESGFSEKFSPDNIDLVKAPVHAGSRLKWKTFLVSFMVDARGGAMRGCRHSGVRVIIPPRKASMPMRITCRYLRKEKLIHPPPLMEGEACASRILEMGPVGARFLGPVIIEVPHFASTRGKEREITILRSDTGESWREHTLEASEEAVQEVLNESFEGEELSALEDLNTNRITRILTTDFPQYFAIVTRIRQEVHGVGPEGGMVSSTVVPQVQAIFPEGALTKKIRVGLQAQPIAPELVTKLLGNRVAVSPIVTVEPRRRKFHKPITLTIPVPQAATKGMINQYSGDAPTLRLLCSITGSTKSGGSSKAQWEDVTGSTPLTFVNDCVSFTTTVSARFWLMDCRQVNEVTRFATELYQEAVYVPFMSKFVIFAKRHDPFEAQLRVFCMTDDKEDKTLESQEHFTEVAKSRDVEVLEGKLQFLEFAGNLVPVTKSGEQLKFTFQAFHENRLPFIIRVKDPHAEPMGRIAFMKEPKAGRGEPPQTPICNLNVALPEITMLDSADVLELVTLEKRYDFIQEAGLSKPELIHRADLRLSDIARELDKDWVLLAQQLDIPEQDVEQIKAQTVCDQSEQARMMLRLWLQKSGSKATGNELEKGLRKINREDIIKNCMFNVELVTDDVEKAVAKVHLDQSGFDVFKEELGSSREASMRRGTSLDDEQDIMKEAESAAETSSETGSLFERDQLSQALTDDRDEYAMLSVHETALSDTDAPFNSNKPAFDDFNNILKPLNNRNNDEDILKSSHYDSDFGERDTLLFSQTGEKMHDFWPPGMIIQTPSINMNEKYYASDESYPEDFANKIEKETVLNDSFPPNISLINVMSAELNADLNDNVPSNTYKDSYESADNSNIINTSGSIDISSESNNINFPIKLDETNSNNCINKFDEQEEYEAVLEPDVEITDESVNNFLSSDTHYKSGSKGVIIEEVPSSNGSESVEPKFSFLSPGISCPMSGNNNKFPSLDAEQNLYPIEENERDDFDGINESGTNFEVPVNESVNSYSVMQNELNNFKSVNLEAQNKVYNGFKLETSTEVSDLGYFSLDKDSSLSSTSVVSEEKMKQVESDLISSLCQDKNRLNENISVSLLPEMNNDIRSTMKLFVNKEEGKLKYDQLDEYNIQIAADKDKLPEISLKTSDPCIKEECKTIKSEDCNNPKGGIEMEKLREISSLLPELREYEVQKPEESDFRKVEIVVKENVILSTAQQEIPNKLTESETWQSGDLDTSQVSVSSLPEDDKSEHTTTTVSSTAIQEVTKNIVPDTEIMDVDKSGTTTHIIQKTTHMTLISHTKPDSEYVEDSAGKSSTDLNENQDKIERHEEVKGALSELKTTESVLHAPIESTQAFSESDKKDLGEHVEPLHPETDTVDSEELCKITKDLYTSEKDSDSVVETQYIEKTNSSFASCAFINTAFAGADAIDEVEQVIPVRARSPYEVIRGEDSQVPDIPLEESKTNLNTTDRVTYITRHVEIKRRPLLQHIPSEISEEDLVEREITSPVPRDELESSDQSAESESKMPKNDISEVVNIKTMPLEDQDREISSVTVIKTVSAPVESVVKDDSSDLTIIKTVTVTKTKDFVCVDQSLDHQETTSIKDQLNEIEIKSDISELCAKAKDITSPESDTGIPTSPFELISETELSDGEQKFSTSAISHSPIKSEQDDKSKDSVITATQSQTISVSAASSDEQKESCTLNGTLDTSKTVDICHVSDHSSIDTVSDAKPLTNGPGEVEYHPEYDDDDEDINKKFEHVYAERSAYETREIDEEPKCHYGSVSDDVIDSEIREILSSDQHLEDIIERPVTPEPPRDDVTDVGFISHLKRPSDGEIEGLMREGGFAYSDDAPLSSPTSPDSKSGFAYGMHFEKYAIDEGEEAMDIDSDQFSEEKEPPFSYNMRFERDPDLEEDVPCYGDLYTHEEEDEDALENGDKSKAMQKPGKDSEFDILAGRKYFTKNVEIDELSMSSLQEFERLEAEIVSGRKSSVGSLDSLNGKQLVSKSGDHDDVSMSSLTEFERIEKECTEGDKIDPSMQESITQLSEIEEGHESQASEASQENKSDVGREDDISIADDYNNQLENIDEIILEVESKQIDELPFQIMMKQKQKPEQTGHDAEITFKEKQIDNKMTDIGKEKVSKASIVTEVTKISSWATSKSLESSSLGDGRDDLDQDSLRDELSLKPDSLIEDAKLDFQDSLHEERFDDADSLQENLDEMRDSLFEERHIEDDSLHEMDIMPDESSLSLEGSLPAIASLDSSKADEPIKSKITNIRDSKDIHPEVLLGSATETFQIRQTQINISDLPRGADIMQSSTDSLEQSSSALAAFQIESESLMSSSLNSAITSEDNTMVSSSDTIEPEGRITYRYEDIPVDDIEMLVRSGHRVIVDSEGNIQAHYDGKQCIETEEIRNTALGFHKNVTEIKLPPTTTVQVHSALTTVEYVNGRREQDKHFHHTSGEEDYESFESSHFDPDVEVEEVQTTDEFGNTKIIRKIKKVSHTKTQFSSSSSPKDVEEKLKEFLREHTAGDKAGTAEEEVEEQKTTDEKGNVVVIRTVKRQIHTEPEIHSKTFTGPTADQQSQKFVETFQTLDPTEDVSEYEKVDEQGNVVRVTEKFVVTPKVHTVSFSGPDAHKQMEDYMKQWTLQSQNVGEFEGDQQRAVLPSLQTGRIFEQSETSAPSDSSQHLVQTVIGDTIVTKTLSSTFSSDSTEKTEIPESSTSTTISLETVRSKSDSSEDKKSMPK